MRGLRGNLNRVTPVRHARGTSGPESPAGTLLISIHVHKAMKPFIHITRYLVRLNV
jgi:hypothetical protein